MVYSVTERLEREKQNREFIKQDMIRLKVRTIISEKVKECTLSSGNNWQQNCRGLIQLYKELLKQGDERPVPSRDVKAFLKRKEDKLKAQDNV